MNQRIEKLRESLYIERYPLFIKKARLVTESFKETEPEPAVLRHAKAQATTLDKMPIFIQDGELIGGNAASKPMGVEAACFEAIWPQDDLAKLKEES